MRKQLREITDKEEIKDLFRNTDVIRLGISDDKQPYVVPVSFGFDWSDEQPTFYFHGAREGKKFELLTKNPFVCVEGDNFYRYKKNRRVRHLSVRKLYRYRQVPSARRRGSGTGAEKDFGTLRLCRNRSSRKMRREYGSFRNCRRTNFGETSGYAQLNFPTKNSRRVSCFLREFLPHNLSLAHYTLQAGQVRFFILLFYLFVLQYLKITGFLEEGYDAYFGEKQEHRLQCNRVRISS